MGIFSKNSEELDEPSTREQLEKEQEDEEEHYDAEYTCDNCGAELYDTVKKGIVISQVKRKKVCDTCGCSAMQEVTHQE